MPISDYTTILDTDLRPGNPYSAALKLQWINEVEGSIWNDIYKYKTSIGILRLTGIAAYALPAGVDFNKITNVYVDGIEIKRIDASFKDTTGYFRGSDGKINIYPLPTANDDAAGLTVSYLTPVTKHTLDSETPYAESPFDRMYYEYLCAKVDLFLKNYDDYTNSIAQFNTTYKEYVIWWADRSATEA